ncbi:MAG TPA: hypothetical protein VGM77_00595 [Gemmatimonadales bacterium]|jgi:hypothetical protein
MLASILLPLLAALQGGGCPAAVGPGACQAAEISEPLEYCDVALRAAAAGPDVGGLSQRERQLTDAPTHSDTAWLELACVRAALSQWERTHVVASTRPHPWHEGALAAALTVAHLRPADTTLLLLSALILRGGVGRPDPARLNLAQYLNLPFSPSIDTVVRYARDWLRLLQQAVSRPSADPRLFRACTAIALDIDEPGVGHECAVRALDTGYEPSWNLARLAWLAARRADTSGAGALLARAVDTARTPAERLDVAWHFKAGSQVSNFPFWGLINPTAPNRLHSGDEDLRSRSNNAWFALPPSEFWTWVDQKSDGGSATGWRSLSDPAVLAEHFASVAFAGEVFRDCLPGDDTAACKGKDLRTVRARRLRFWDMDNGPIAVFAFTTKTDTGHDSLRVTVDQAELGRRGHTDTVTVSVAAEGSIISVPSNDKWDSWTLDIDPAHPAHSVDFQDFQPSVGKPAVILSDLAVASAGTGLPWITRGRRIPIAPTDTFSRAAPLELFYQVRCDSGCGEIKRTTALRPAGRHGNSLTLTFDAVLHPGINDVEQEVDLTRLAAGSYRLEIEILTESARSIRRSTLLVLR